VHAPNEDLSENDPDKRWPPAPHNRKRRANNWASPGNACEVMSEDNWGRRWYEVVLIPELNTWHNKTGIERK